MSDETPAASSAPLAEPEGTVAASTTDPGTTETLGSRSRKRVRSLSPVVDAVTAAALASAAQQAAAHGWHGLASTLQTQPTSTSTASSSSSSPLPSPTQVQQAAQKSLQETPPWIHFGKTDMAPQVKVTDTSRLALQGPVRGYRMARASHGASAGNVYFECWIQPGPTAHEIRDALPAQARLGGKLQELLQKGLEWEESQQKLAAAAVEESKEDDDDEAESFGRTKKRKQQQQQFQEGAPPSVGGHLRIGWSMRTGDLQAPVGYDKWSYAIRDIGGSIVHNSQRQDHWGGEGFGPGDVLGCGICLTEATTDDATTTTTTTNHHPNHIRFFKNGDCLGQFVISKGKREGGEAFTEIEPGTYYPAVSSYLGGAVKVNFGPHFVNPPRKLPAGLKFKPLSDVCPPPLTPDEAVQKMAATAKLFRKPEHQEALKEAVKAEAQVLCQAYEEYMQTHKAEVKAEREERGLSVGDL